jgi:large subunit ribosomal protein L25
MSKTYALNADKRDGAGKGAARALRRDNKVPAVIYGDSKDPLVIALSAKDINLEYQKGHMFTNLCNLSVGGTQHLVLMRDAQLHPLKDTVEHVDFLRVTPKTMIHVQVPLHFINQDECPGLTLNKGILTIGSHEIELVCQATNIPESVDVDMTGKEIGDSVHLSEIKLPDGAKSASKRDVTLVTINAPRRAVEETPAAAEGDAAAAPAADAAKKPEEKKG